MNTVQTRRVRTESPERWVKAAERAVSEGIRISQVQSSGQWIATSGTDATIAYEVQVTGNVAHTCDCLAALNNDPCCKHRAAFYLLIGSIDLTPEPPPAAPALTIACSSCSGGGVVYDREIERLGLLYPPCPVCRGAGTLPAAVELPAAPVVERDRIAA